MKKLIGQYNIIGKAALSSLAPALARLGWVLLGIIIGLLWAYQGAPVKFYDAEPVHLADGYKDQWIKMTAAEFAQTGDVEEATRKVVDGGIKPDRISQLIEDNQAADPELASQLQLLLPVAQANKSAASDQADKVKTGGLGNLLGPLACLFGAAIVGLLLSAVLTFYWVPPIGKWAKKKVATGRSVAVRATDAGIGTMHQERLAVHKRVVEQKTDFEVPPVAQYMSTYVSGDDLYDDSFSIETATGDFLGECGAGISETIGVGEPKKVTAFEVWLFDKNDIRTITKVLMSQHAYNDQALRTKLAPKGEAVLVQPDTVTVLETQTLRLQVRVVDMQYGEGPLPPNSFLGRFTVELAAWPKEDAGTGEIGGPQPSDPSSAFGDTAELLNY